MLTAFVEIKKHIPDAQLWYAGTGKPAYIESLKKRITDAGLDTSVVLYGFVSEQVKFELLARAHILAVPSKHEGWGLVVAEAGLVKTPAVVYNVPGLRDVTVHNKTGLTVSPDPVALSGGILHLLQNEEQYQLMQQQTYNNATAQTWDITANIALQWLTKKSYEKA
jgi:glycosyltransferase involved in cell wall biosynthesis